MKLSLSSLFGSAKSTLSRHTHRLLALLLVALLAVGGYYSWGYYQYRQSCQFAFAGLQQALTPPSAEELAVRVDFNTVAEELATATAEAFPFYRAGEDQIHSLKSIIQTHLLRASLGKDSGEGKKKEEAADEASLLMQPLQVLPSDFMAQFATSLKLDKVDENSALLHAVIRHPMLKETYTPILRLLRTPDGWIVRNLVNAKELALQFRTAVLRRLEARHAILVNKRSSVLKRMESTLPLRSCTASAGLLSDQKTLLVVAHTMGHNASTLTVKNIALDLSLKDTAGQLVLRRILNASCDIPPGAELDRHWTIELDAQSEEGKRVLAAGQLTSTAIWRTLSLSSAEVLHVEDLPPALPPCAVHQHQHPHGLCLKPIFTD